MREVGSSLLRRTYFSPAHQRKAISAFHSDLRTFGRFDGRKCRHSSSSFQPQAVQPAPDARIQVLTKAAMAAAEGGKMRVLSQMELNRLTRNELLALQRTIAVALTGFREGSIELRAAHANLANIRARLVAPRPGPRW
jgi:hypothetical protein